jgi:hypothetical protein
MQYKLGVGFADGVKSMIKQKQTFELAFIFIQTN